jgi:hypothetical protein
VLSEANWTYSKLPKLTLLRFADKESTYEFHRFIWDERPTWTLPLADTNHCLQLNTQSANLITVWWIFLSPHTRLSQNVASCEEAILTIWAPLADGMGISEGNYLKKKNRLYLSIGSYELTSTCIFATLLPSESVKHSTWPLWIWEKRFRYSTNSSYFDYKSQWGDNDAKIKR